MKTRLANKLKAVPPILVLTLRNDNGQRAEKLRNHIAVGSKFLLRGRPEAREFLRADGTSAGELVLHINELEFLSPRPKTQPAEELPLTAPPEKPKRCKSR